MINCAKFHAGFFSAGKAAGSVDTGGISGFCQRSMPEKRQVKCASYYLTVPYFALLRTGVQRMQRILLCRIGLQSQGRRELI
jgi:hypothetical protein